jgi:glycosyltransferase involved in cell wall biosynthesis
MLYGFNRLRSSIEVSSILVEEEYENISMRNTIEQVTIAITTFNEQDNIIDCLTSIFEAGFENIHIYDGGSTDLTFELVREKFPNIAIKKSNSSLSTRRKLAIDSCETSYLFFVDADQRLLKHNYAEIIDENFKTGVAGIQFVKIAPKNGEISYWQRGFELRNKIIAQGNEHKKVIGTPCIYLCSALKKFNYSDRIDGAADDTLVGHLLSQNNYHFVCVEEEAVEIFRPTAQATIRKAFWYGLGDAEFIRKSQSASAKRNHLFHVLIRNPFVYPIQGLFRKPIYSPFLAFFGISRLAGFFAGFMNSTKEIKKS